MTAKSENQTIAVGARRPHGFHIESRLKSRHAAIGVMINTENERENVMIIVSGMPVIQYCQMI